MKKTVLVIVILAVGYLLGGIWPIDRYLLNQHSVVINADIELPKDSGFKDTNVKGTLLAGSTCTQKLRKGSLSYLSCSVIVPNHLVQ